MRHRLLPRMTLETPDLTPRLAVLASLARRAQRTLRRRLEERIEIRVAPTGIAARRADLEALPRELLAPALALIQRQAGALHPPRRATCEELRLQLAPGRRIGCDGGGGWRWRQQGPWIVFRREQAAIPPFTYTLGIPGTARIPELGLEMTVERIATAEALGFETTLSDFSLGVPREASALLALPLLPGDQVTVRNRRPGDRLVPPGHRTEVRLKEILIDRKVPRSQRDSLPILCARGNIAWVAGVVTDERFRARAPAWRVTVRTAEELGP